MRIEILILVGILSVKKVNGQFDNVSKYINNDSIKFDLVMTMPDFENGVYYSDYAVSVKNLDSIGKMVIHSLNKKQWMRLLKSAKSDWAANIILYSMYNKSAGIFRTAVKTRDNWAEKNREADLAYWQSFLK